MNARNVALTLLVVATLAIAAFTGYAWRPELDPVEPPGPSAFDARLIAKGAGLALIGNCNVCHTAQSGAPYAGGRPLQTPFGTIHATNITPDPETGIGRWSEAAFIRAMREGVDRSGRHLYPAFPYDHYTLMTDEDIRAIYAFLMTRQAVRAEAPANDLPFPLDIRLLLAGWKLLFLDQGVFQPQAGRDPAWNRGAYLVRGPGHCGACHTPRNFLGAEKDRFLTGGESEGWLAPALNPAASTPVPWTADSLHRYLRSGIAKHHAITAGPMTDVIRNLATAPEEDVRAMAVYVASLAGQISSDQRRVSEELLAKAKQDAAAARPGASEAPAQAQVSGREIYESACGVCHDGGRRSPSSGNALHLALATVTHLRSPRNLLHIIVDGIHPPPGEHGRWMPAFAGALSDRQLAELVIYIRSEFSRSEPWKSVEEEVRSVNRRERGRSGSQ